MEMVVEVGVEPTTNALSRRCSTIELHDHFKLVVIEGFAPPLNAYQAHVLLLHHMTVKWWLPWDSNPPELACRASALPRRRGNRNPKI
jgi:hypothetical protein